MKRIKFFTFGCKVNQYETQSIRESFLNAGFQEKNDNSKVDIYLINTCTVTQKADSESLNYIRRVKRENPYARVIVTGCLVEKDLPRLSGMKEIDLIVSKRFFREGVSGFNGHARAFLKLQDGCNNFCSYCKVPLVRGVSRSRTKEAVIQEAMQLVENGYKEIVLTGVCLGAYGKDLRPQVALTEIITELEKITDLCRIRLSSIEAGDISDALIEQLATSLKLCPHLHLPLQSGDDEILKRMNRKYTSRTYLNLIKKLKAKIPELAITTDVLVGFPGETEENFQNTVALFKKVMPLKAHIFIYSRREGTAAARLKQELNYKVARERSLYLKQVAKDCSFKYRKQFLNKKMGVLIEGESKQSAGFWEGYTDNYIKVLVKSGSDLTNQLISLKLNQVVQDDMLGEI